MKSAWLHGTVLRAASLLAPADQRGEWLDGWRSELWYVPRRGSLRFCLGAFQDALWLRRNDLSETAQRGNLLESPFACLGFLATLAALSGLLAICLPGPQLGPRPSHLSARDLPDGCVGMLMLSGFALSVVRLAMGPRISLRAIPWPNRLRRGMFLALKIAFLQPILFCGFVVTLPLLRLPIANLGFNAAWLLLFRWVLIDQRRRCPECLRLLTEPVRIGTPSQTFLAWYGSESVCSRGHGLLHDSEVSSDYSGSPGWLRLGDSWSGLF